MAEQNSFIIEGTLYDKHTRTVKGKKDPEKEYNFNSIKLEIVTQGSKKQYTEVPEFQLANWVGMDSFEVGDHLKVRFQLKGKEMSDTWHKTELFATNIWFADTQADKGEIKSKDVPLPDEVFNDPQEEMEDDLDLPF